MRRSIGLLMMLLFGLAGVLHANPPVLTIGAEGHSGIGSSDPGSITFAAGPELNLDFRTIIGDWGYGLVWYTGRLWFDGLVAPTDAQSAGGLIGAQLGETTAELSSRVSFSTPLGDGMTFAAPEWKLLARVPIGFTELGITLAGLYYFENESPLTELSHGAEIALVMDGSLDLGLTAGLSSYLSLFPHQFVLDDGGLATAERRTDTDARIGLEAEGLLGFFSSWSASVAGGFIESNANRYLPALDIVETDSEDRFFAAGSASIDSSVIRSMALSGLLTIRFSHYPSRRSLDQNGNEVAPDTAALRFEPGAGMDWNLFGPVYLQINASGVYGVSRDQSMSGWSAGGSVGIHYRF